MIEEKFSTQNCSDIRMYSFAQQLGKGAYAVVYEGIHKPSGERVAIKQYDKSKLGDHQRRK